MKIAMIGQKGIPAHYGGVERIVEQLSERLVKLGHDVTVYTRPYYTPKIKTSHEGVRLVSLPSLHTKHFDAITHTFLATIHAIREGFDIIHYHSVGPALLSFIPRLLSPRTKVVIDFQCRDALHQKWGRFARFILTLGERAAVRFAHVTTVPTRILAEYCEKAYGKKVVVVPNGMYLPQLRSAHLVREEFGLEPQSYILVVSRLVRHKGIHYLIDAYNKLKTNMKLVIVGDAAFTGEYVSELKQRARGNDGIIFTGWQAGPMLEELFSNAYLYIHPSETEGMSLSILEAAAYNKCILSSDIRENREIVDACGFTFKTKNVADLGEKLRYLLHNPRVVEDSGKKARKLIEEKYLWDHITSALDRLYYHLIHKPTLS